MSGVDALLNGFNSFVGKFILFNVNPFGGIDIPFVVAFVIIACIYLSFRLNFFYIKYLPYAFTIAFRNHGTSEDHGEAVSAWKILFAEIAGSVGVGMVAGVAIAVSIGGPGAVFWMIVTAFVCMPLRFAEVFLGHKYRVKTKNGYTGGPNQYISSGFAELGMKKFGKRLAFTYSVLFVISTFGGACSFQSNQIVEIVTNSFPVLSHHKALISLVIISIVGYISLGGITRVIDYLSKVIKIIVGVYFISSIIVLIKYHDMIGYAIKIIFHEAFMPKAVFGGSIGSFLIGFKRIIFASETGAGTAPTIHANAKETSSVREGMLSMICPLINTFFICLMTGLVVIVTGAYKKTELGGISMVQNAFNSVSPILGYLLLVIISIIAMNVMIAWSYYGAKNWHAVFKKSESSKVFLILFLLSAFVGGVSNNLDQIVEFCDIVNLSIIIPNVFTVLILSKKIVSGYRDFEKRRA